MNRGELMNLFNKTKDNNKENNNMDKNIDEMKIDEMKIEDSESVLLDVRSEEHTSELQSQR